MENAGCNCRKISAEDITRVVDEVVEYTGKEPEQLIMILQEIQKKLNYLPSEALKHICRITGITPGQISGVSTFYTQFRHIPAGRYTIKVCTGTACHVKGAPLISDAFRRVLKIDNTRNASPDNLFSIEEVACLGCCTLAPVVQIDGKTYGHVRPTQAEGIIKDFLQSGKSREDSILDVPAEDIDAEVRVGLGSCCVAGGSKELLAEIMEVRYKFDLNLKMKPVGCVGVCNQTPLMEIVTRDQKSSRYTNVRRDQVEDILLKHIRPRSLNKRLKSNLFDLVDTFLTDDKLTSQINVAENRREKHLNNFLQRQVHIATANGGTLTPDSFDEYCMLGGFSALRICLNEPDRKEIVKDYQPQWLKGKRRCRISDR